MITGTITLDAEAPSHTADASNPAVVLASQGYIVVAADYVGYPLLGAVLKPGFLKYLSGADRNNVRDFLLQQLMGNDSDVVFMPTAIDNYFADDRASIERLSDVYNWRPEAPLYLFQGWDDNTVAYLNATTALQAMQTLGAGTQVSLTQCTAQPAGHSQCVPPFWRFLLENFAQVAKDL